MTDRRLLLPAAALAVMLLAAGCSTDPAGPLGGSGSPGYICSPARPDQPITMAFFSYQNSSKNAVKVTGVSLTGDHGLKMGKPWLTPIYGNTLIGTAAWPPTARAWTRRYPANGAVIKARQNVNLVFKLWRTRDRYSYAHLTMTYTSGGTSYTLTQGWRVIVATSCPS
jgi:hypothetical protein